MDLRSENNNSTSDPKGMNTCAGSSRSKSPERRCYEIRFKGHLDDHWVSWFHGCSQTREEDGSTVMVAPVVDQAELFGLLNKVRDLSLSLISVNQIDPLDYSTDI
jgi:hypothetical protein